MIDIDNKILELAEAAEKRLAPTFEKVDNICLTNSQKILDLFRSNHVTYADFSDINGYGNYDPGRDKIEAIFASILGMEDALVRPQIMSGTTAIYLALSALLKHGDTLMYITGKPYDSLLETIGVIGSSSQSLKANGVKYEQIDLIDNDFDYPSIKERVSKGNIKVIAIQRSRGYSDRLSLTLDKIEKVVNLIKSIDKNIIIFVDNCYGELVETREPGHVGCDITVGSLMKNLGGGIASSGGYVAGRKDLIQMVSERLSAPGIGKEQGANYNQNINILKGIYMAPSAVKNALKTQIFAAYMLQELGYDDVSPKWNEDRTDIIQTVGLKTKENLVAFTRGIQNASPIDSDVLVMPAPMPGYPFDEVMAAGCFTQGSTIELSCDAPMVEPYTLYMQGGLTYEYGKLSIMIALSKLNE